MSRSARPSGIQLLKLPASSARGRPSGGAERTAGAKSPSPGAWGIRRGAQRFNRGQSQRMAAAKKPTGAPPVGSVRERRTSPSSADRLRSSQNVLSTLAADFYKGWENDVQHDTFECRRRWKSMVDHCGGGARHVAAGRDRACRATDKAARLTGPPLFAARVRPYCSQDACRRPTSGENPARAGARQRKAGAPKSLGACTTAFA